MLMEKTISTTRAFTGNLLTVDRIEVKTSSGIKTREIVNFPEVVVVLALDIKSRMILVKQYRKAANAVLLEPVAGKIEPGESPEAAAEREFKEETGLNLIIGKRLGVVYPVPGYSTEMQYYFNGVCDMEQGEQSSDDAKKIKVVRMTGYKVMQHVYSGVRVDGKLMTALGFFLTNQIKEGGIYKCPIM